jgi:radical SAM/Cys-rich protein
MSGGAKLRHLPLAGEPDSGQDAGFAQVLSREGRSLRRGAVTTVQINVGKLCNMACLHCHVDAGPRRTEIMPARVAERVLQVLAASRGVRCVDITGGAPELNPHFREIVVAATRAGHEVIDRCNLSVLLELPKTAEFLAENAVHVIASLPCYSAANVDRQRGAGAFDKSVRALRLLNGLGYGRPDSGLELDLVYNPVGASLPPSQATLEAKYRAELRAAFGVEFNRLLTLTNMPIARFAHALARDEQLDGYMDLLMSAHNPAAVDHVMCRSLVSVSWDGRLFDCDFNQMLELPHPEPQQRTLWDIASFDALSGSSIATGRHCFGCTAGAGSSCGGALS